MLHVLSVVSFNSTKRRAQYSVVSYFRFRFTAAYNNTFCSLLFVVVVHAGCNKQDSLMRGDLYDKPHGRPSQLFTLTQSSIDSQIFVENRDFAYPSCIRRPC